MFYNSQVAPIHMNVVTSRMASEVLILFCWFGWICCFCLVEVLLLLFLYYALILRQDLKYPRLASNLICNWGWGWTSKNDPPFFFHQWDRTTGESPMLRLMPTLTSRLFSQKQEIIPCKKGGATYLKWRFLKSNQLEAAANILVERGCVQS